MNGAHDMGGLHRFGPIQTEGPEPVFHQPWERRVFALTLAAGFLGRWTLDMARYAREDRHPLDYLASSYYELWLKGLERLLVERGVVDAAELEVARPLAGRPAGVRTAPDAVETAAILRRGASARRAEGMSPRFRVADRVRVRDLNTGGHTRAPRYCRGRCGIVERDHGIFVFPDTNARDMGERPQHLYSVRFDAHTLWGDGAAENTVVCIDLWDDYLDPVS